jgi:PAS domain S-box-containing protein
MSKYSIITFTISLLWVYLGLKTLLRDRRNKLNIMFSLVCLAFVLWSVPVGIAFSLKSYENVSPLVKLAYLGLFFFFPLNLHFSVVISKSKIKTWIVAACYMPAVLLNILSVLGYSIFSELIKQQHEMIAVFDTHGFPFYFYIFSILLCYFLTIVILSRWGRETGINKEKFYSRFIIITLSIAYLGSLITTIILPAFKIYTVQAIGAMLVQLYVVGLYFLIARFRFLNVDYNLMANEIISNIDDIVFLLDINRNVLDVNDQYGHLLSVDTLNIRGRNFLDLIVENDFVKEKFRELAGNRIKNINTRVHYKKDDAHIITKSYIARIIDKFNDVTGFLVISSEIKEMKQFQQYFKITSRELDIIGSIISGQTYRETADSLHITEKTVETHLTNIYNKLGINNKIELIKVAGKFNLSF